MSKQIKREIEILEEENNRLKIENAALRDKLKLKKSKLRRSSENLQELAERKAQEILRNEERFKIVVNVSKGGIMNLVDSPVRSSPQRENE